MSLREMQYYFTFGTPARDGFEHRKNCEDNQWHSLYEKEDDDGQLPLSDYLGMREVLTIDKTTEESTAHLQSMKVREQLSDYIATAGVMSQEAVTEQLFADSVAPGGGVH